MNTETVPTFSLAYTSVRPALISKVVESWNKRAVNPLDIEWVISVDADDAPSLAAASACHAAKVVINDGAKTCVAGWNSAAAATTGKVIIAVADDFWPPQGWDALLLALAPKGWIEGEYVVHVNDGYVRSLCTLAILTRKRYARFGLLDRHPGGIGRRSRWSKMADFRG